MSLEKELKELSRDLDFMVTDFKYEYRYKDASIIESIVTKLKKITERYYDNETEEE